MREVLGFWIAAHESAYESAYESRFTVGRSLAKNEPEVQVQREQVSDLLFLPWRALVVREWSENSRSYFLVCVSES